LITLLIYSKFSLPLVLGTPLIFKISQVSSFFYNIPHSQYACEFQTLQTLSPSKSEEEERRKAEEN
jgi:hypothetical protein